MIYFSGVDGYDVYNCSQIFTHDGHRFMYGRVEKRADWINSHIRLFIEVGRDQWAAVVDSIYPLEDPYISRIDDHWVLGGTHVKMQNAHLAGYWSDFYRGNELARLRYFTCGPDGMKDVRLIQLADGRIGVFSRPRQATMMVGFTIIADLTTLGPETIDNAVAVDGMFGAGDWGGVNQVYLLADGRLGLLYHHAYEDAGLQHYSAWACEFDPERSAVTNNHQLVRRADFAAGPAKLPRLADVVFPSGLVMAGSDRVDLYCGLNDVQEARVTLPYPFTTALAKSKGGHA